MKSNIVTKRIFLIAMSLALVASVFCVAFCSSSVAQAGKWGDTYSNTLWQYQEGYLDTDSAKTIVKSWDLSSVTPVTIAVIDTGIDTAHELFDGVLATNSNGDVLGYNASTGADSDGKVDISDQEDKHGSEIAGVIAMLIHEFGLENYIKIYPIKANTDKTKTFSLANLTKAVNWAVNNAHADVINMSLGMTESVYNSKSDAERNSFEVAIEKALQSSVVVAAAGNKQDGDTMLNKAFYPASLSGVVSVANQANDVNGALYQTSYYHSTTDICAPGEAIYTSKGYVLSSRYTNASGTSLSAASVSFASALLNLRFQVEGRGASAQIISKTICSFDYPTSITKDKFTYSALNLKTIVDSANSLDDVNLNYKTPTSMSLVHNGNIDKGEYTGLIYMRADNISAIDFYVRISPDGDVDPLLEKSVEWSVDRIKSADDYTVVESKSLGKGKGITYTAPSGGDYIIKAKLPYYNFEVSQQIHIEYAKYYVGEVRVTYADRALDGVDNAPSSGTDYAKNVNIFALTGIEYLNPYETITWYVNGEYAGEGAEFVFAPQKAGTYYITARYGDESMVDFDYKFTLTVKSFILRPLDLSMLIIGLTIAVAGITTLTVVLVKRKKKKKEEQVTQ